MILSGKMLLKELQPQGRIRIEPFNLSQLNPNSYNVRLSSRLAVYCPADYTPFLKEITATTRFPSVELDCKRANPIFSFNIPAEGLVLYPGKLYLGATIERTETDWFVPMLEGRSSLGRLGLSVHQTAGFGDRGFRGTWTLELTCVEPLRIYAGISIGQVQFWECRGDSLKDGLYQGKYLEQKDPTPSKLYKEL